MTSDNKGWFRITLSFSLGEVNNEFENWPTSAQSFSELTFREITSFVFSGISGGISDVVEFNSTW